MEKDCALIAFFGHKEKSYLSEFEATLLSVLQTPRRMPMKTIAFLKTGEQSKPLLQRSKSACRK